MIGEGAVIVQGRGRGYFARVRVDYTAESGDVAGQPPEPILNPRWPELIGWAEEGASLGLELAGFAGRCSVREVRVHEVNAPHPTLVAIAAVRAAWAAAGFTPDTELARRLEHCIGMRGPATMIRACLTAERTGETSPASPGTRVDRDAPAQ